ncbi:hypothetical protein BHE74_00001792 [Ensete ventricosum]|nr:hypothetical protein BHE74_00001792 [Ensete ventricosum]
MDAQKISLRNGRPASAGSETDDDNTSLLVKASQMKREPPKINPVERLSDRRTGLAKVITYTCPIYPQGGSRSMPSHNDDNVGYQACHPPNQELQEPWRHLHPQEVERKGDCPADPDPSAGTAGDSRARENVVMQDDVV